MEAGGTDGPGGSAIEPECGRTPARYALQYHLRLERVLSLVLSRAGIAYTVLTFRRRLPRHQGLVVRHWLPGYMFVEFDIEHDPWQTVLSAPGVIDLLGSPTAIPDATFRDLVLRCPDEVRTNDELTVIPAGSDVEITEGALKGHRGVVSRSQGDSVWVELVAFNRLTHAELRTRHVMILG